MHHKAKQSAVKKYKTIVVDPPWKYGRSWDTGSSKAIIKTTEAVPMPYDEMTLSEIEALQVRDLADSNCELYLWTTGKYLPKAYGVIDEWGFKYCQTLVWCKKPMGTGQGGLYCPTTEFLLLGRLGRMPIKKRINSTWFEVKRTMRHSEKPEFFQDMIEKQTDGPRVELFARRKRPGWDVWGNEVVSDVEFFLTDKGDRYE